MARHGYRPALYSETVADGPVPHLKGQAILVPYDVVQAAPDSRYVFKDRKEAWLGMCKDLLALPADPEWDDLPFELWPETKVVLVLTTLTLRNVPHADGGLQAPGVQFGRPKALWWMALQISCGAVVIVCAEEFGSQNDRLHYHCLSLMPKSSLTKRVSASFLWGGIDEEVIDNVEAAIGYVVKYVIKDVGVTARVDPWFQVAQADNPATLADLPDVEWDRIDRGTLRGRGSRRYKRAEGLVITDETRRNIEQDARDPGTGSAPARSGGSSDDIGPDKRPGGRKRGKRGKRKPGGAAKDIAQMRGAVARDGRAVSRRSSAGASCLSTDVTLWSRGHALKRSQGSEPS